MAWFELDTDMPDDPKCAALGVRLKTPLAFGYVVRLYAYCYRHGTDRFSGPGAPATIEMTACAWRGRAGHLLAALIAEGFIDHAEGETLVVHGVAKRLEPHIAKRERDAERMRERRANVARTSRERLGDKDKDKDKDPSENTIVSEGDPPAPRDRPARVGLGCAEGEAVAHWQTTAWPRLSSDACPAPSEREVNRLRGLCRSPGLAAVKAAMDRATSDPWWSQPGKLDLGSFITNFGKFTARNAPAAAPTVTQPPSPAAKFEGGARGF